MGSFSILFRMVLRSTPPIFSFLLIFSNLFPISTGLLCHLHYLNGSFTSDSGDSYVTLHNNVCRTSYELVSHNFSSTRRCFIVRMLFDTL